MNTYEYTLPSGRASFSTTREDLEFAEKEFSYPAKRKELQKALEEALIELWRIANDDSGTDAAYLRGYRAGERWGARDKPFAEGVPAGPNQTFPGR